MERFAVEYIQSSRILPSVYFKHILFIYTNFNFLFLRLV